MCWVRMLCSGCSVEVDELGWAYPWWLTWRHSACRVPALCPLCASAVRFLCLLVALTRPSCCLTASSCCLYDVAFMSCSCGLLCVFCLLSVCMPVAFMLPSCCLHIAFMLASCCLCEALSVPLFCIQSTCVFRSLCVLLRVASCCRTGPSGCLVFAFFLHAASCCLHVAFMWPSECLLLHVACTLLSC